jgi:hypothetical protein
LNYDAPQRRIETLVNRNTSADKNQADGARSSRSGRESGDRCRWHRLRARFALSCQVSPPVTARSTPSRRYTPRGGPSTGPPHPPPDPGTTLPSLCSVSPISLLACDATEHRGRAMWPPGAIARPRASRRPRRRTRLSRPPERSRLPPPPAARSRDEYHHPPRARNRDRVR